MKRCLLYLLIVLSVFPAQAAHALKTENLQVSLLTVMPRPNEIYTVYGHTALRLYDPAQQIDIAFNWGTFDFQAPHFLYRFIKGETDYFLSTSDYAYFLRAYSQGNATVTEQVLNMTPEGKEKLLQILSLNLLPENRVYRYNFLFDNCTTRVRDLIEDCTGASLVYPVQAEKATFRQLIHSCTAAYPWMTFGIDLLIGSGADSTVSLRQELFLPLRLKEALDRSVAAPSVPVVASVERVLVSSPGDDSTPAALDFPLITGYCLFFLCLVAGWAGWRRKRLFGGFFAPLFFLAGAAGCLVGFTALFSEHPCTSPNWNLLWLHPFHWIAFAGYFLKKKPFFLGFHAINLALLLAVLAGWRWIPQALNPANIPYILCLAVADAQYLLFFKDAWKS
ncbi:MAG: DUF4105 domain-containing protein [Dysgonamonadaceae bacterium]|jgi:hypothetical protein|nr:DUF4105 domain-containing protein [Dysgonamonadaceae bacterium]